jgi:hypothetical protein
MWFAVGKDDQAGLIIERAIVARATVHHDQKRFVLRELPRQLDRMEAGPP